MALLLFVINLLCILFMIVVLLMVFSKFIGKIRGIGYGKLLLVMGIILSCIFLTDFILIAAMTYITRNQAPGYIVLDWHPIPDMVSFVINWIIPFVVIALLLILYTNKKELKKRSGFIGAALSILSTVGLFCLAQYMFTEYLGESLKSWIWWF